MNKFYQIIKEDEQVIENRLMDEDGLDEDAIIPVKALQNIALQSI